MVVHLLPVELDSRRRRLVVGGKLWLLPMARPSRPASSVPARAASMLVVPAPLPSSLSSAAATEPDSYSDANSAATRRDTNSHFAATGIPHAHSNATANVHREPGRNSANAIIYWSSGFAEIDRDTDAHARSHHSETNYDSNSESHAAAPRTRQRQADNFHQFQSAHQQTDCDRSQADDDASQQQSQTHAEPKTLDKADGEAVFASKSTTARWGFHAYLLQFKLARLQCIVILAHGY